jgi:uncharacterized protein (DUF488 family)
MSGAPQVDSRVTPSRLAEQRPLFSGERYRSSFESSRPDLWVAGDRVVFTIGHSTRKLEELIAVLRRYGVRRIVDIRHFPSSRHNPQFNRAMLERSLPDQGLEYLWLQKLGGYREGGYEAYMDTPDFGQGLEELERLAGEKPTAYMCAEVKWWKCHRRRVSDQMARRGWRVVHILDEERADEHCPKENTIQCD